ncbi:AAA family ATPase [Pseudaestuariivita atlantica]|uniref:Pilus assembly protein CpaE n=1 Tax=Pseudaestuariivita atlantica TaxID=1317121 RepID=A0A0L1JTI1_9RHOB|nr:AAA family ATPase [Pseudaestuariivita atlantica]KNG95050.1 pilus assembly protein CpaE [Pseudaestuariivita atlantica]
MSETILGAEEHPLVACTISRDVQLYDLLIEDMEDALGEGWGDLGFDEAIPFMGQPDGERMSFIAIAIDKEDEGRADQLSAIIHKAATKGIKVILIAEDVKPATLHKLLREGADEFVPYPLPEGELQAAITKIMTPAPAAQDGEEAAPAKPTSALSKTGAANGALIAVQGLAGGVGATTLVTNLAWELATVTKTDGPRVCILDLDLQMGSVSTYMDLTRREAVFEMLSDIDSMDEDSFGQALVGYENKVQVLTAPPDLLPLDMIGPEEVEKILDMARQHFDYVIVDMPKTLVQWSETILTSAHVYLAMIELDMRSAQNALRMKRALQSEGLPFDKLRFMLNRAPKFTDLQGKARVKRMAESLGISIDLQMPDGGRPILQACDHGQPLAVAAAKNPLRREIMKLAASIHAVGQTDAEAA